MKTIRRLIYREILGSVAFVAMGFLALFFFFDFVDDLQHIGKHAAAGYTLGVSVFYVALQIPNHLYELLPIAVLIGTIFVMARFAQSSEYTILRTSGLGPWRALATLLTLGLFFVMLTFAFGDYIAPISDRAAQLLKSRYQGNITTGQTGAWLKERQQYHAYAVNVTAIASDGSLRGVRIYEFDAKGAMVSQTLAPTARFARDQAWILEQAQRSEFGAVGKGQALGPVQITRTELPDFRWPTEISAEMVSTALLKPERMATYDLFQYIQHLDANGQTSERYEIEFWKKVFYPLACLVMVVLALPFAYLHFRAGGITSYVFGGVMIGISFFLVNNVFSHAGNLQNWSPWLTAAAPGLLYSVLSLAAFGWLVLRR